MCPATDVTKKLYIPTKHRSYWCLEFSPPTHHKYVKDPRESTYSSHTEKEPTKKEIALEKKLTSKASDDRWHLRLGYPGPETLKHLLKAIQGDITVSYTPTTKECEVCTISKAQQKLAVRSSRNIPLQGPFNA